MSKKERAYAYRDLLIEGEREMQEQYDKTVITLSGGAFAVSFAFIENIVGNAAAFGAGWLVASWTMWAFSIVCVVASFLTSAFSFRSSLKDLDGRIRADDLDQLNSGPGDKFEKTTAALNIAGGALFFAGLLSIVRFVWLNI